MKMNVVAFVFALTAVSSTFAQTQTDAGFSKEQFAQAWQESSDIASCSSSATGYSVNVKLWDVGSTGFPLVKVNSSDAKLERIFVATETSGEFEENDSSNKTSLKLVEILTGKNSDAGTLDLSNDDAKQVDAKLAITGLELSLKCTKK